MVRFLAPYEIIVFQLSRSVSSLVEVAAAMKVAGQGDELKHKAAMLKAGNVMVVIPIATE